MSGVAQNNARRRGWLYMNWSKGRSKTEVRCVTCKSLFFAVNTEIARGKGRCCSRGCASALSAKNRDTRGEKNPNWRGGIKGVDTRKSYRLRNPIKYEAHKIMRNAIRRGDLLRGRCDVCGDHSVEGHHEDYSKPLDIIWLCKAHHMERHKNLRSV